MRQAESGADEERFVVRHAGQLFNGGSGDFPVGLIAVVFGEDAPEGAVLTVDPRQLLPEGASPMYAYSGSLTTPPCSEGVRWFVLAEPTHASEAQIDSMVARQGRTNRPLQELHGRQVARG